VKALDVLLALAPFLTDESKLDRLVPYVIELLRDDAALVRASAMRTLTQVVSIVFLSPNSQELLANNVQFKHQVMLVSAIPASNASFFPEYVLPNVKYLTRDPDAMVRVVFAQCIVPLAETAIQFLEMSQAVKAHGTVKSKEAKELNATFEEVR
jgi:phosphoinositide-3-kinase regulatory subunit 4